MTMIINYLAKKMFYCVFMLTCFFSGQVLSQQDDKKNMTRKAIKWVASELAVPLENIKVTPPDNRVRISKCKAKIEFDFPFASKETVRARCKNPSWQFFLRVSSENQNTVKKLRPKTNTKKKEVPTKIISVLVASKNLMVGEILREDSVKLEKKQKNMLPVDIFTDIVGLENQEMARSIKAGQIIRSIDIKAAKLIKKGDKVLFSIMAQGMLVKATVEAMQDGRMGDQIKLLNKDSGQTVIGIVIGKNQVKGL